MIYNALPTINILLVHPLNTHYKSNYYLFKILDNSLTIVKNIFINDVLN